MSEGPVEVWRGAVQAWECDHMGHFNTRFYVEKLELALAGLYAELGVDPAEVTLTSQHIRFHREVRAGGAIYATAQVVRMDANDADLMIRIIHSSSDLLSANFALHVTCAQDWPQSARDRAAGLDGPLEDAVLPRGLQAGEGDDQDMSRERAQSLGMQATARSVILRDRCDEYGRLRLGAAMGLIADAIPNLRGGEWREVLKQTAPSQPQRLGGALVEFTFHHKSWPSVGDRIEIWSAAVECTDKITKAAHWLIDPATGQGVASVRAVGVSLDLDARKLVPITPEAQEAYRKEAVSGL